MEVSERFSKGFLIPSALRWSRGGWRWQRLTDGSAISTQTTAEPFILQCPDLHTSYIPLISINTQYIFKALHCPDPHTYISHNEHNHSPRRERTAAPLTSPLYSLFQCLPLFPNSPFFYCTSLGQHLHQHYPEYAQLS